MSCAPAGEWGYTTGFYVFSRRKAVIGEDPWGTLRFGWESIVTHFVVPTPNNNKQATSTTINASSSIIIIIINNNDNDNTLLRFMIAAPLLLCFPHAWDAKKTTSAAPIWQGDCKESISTMEDWMIPSFRKASSRTGNHGPRAPNLILSHVNHCLLKGHRAC